MDSEGDGGLKSWAVFNLEGGDVESTAPNRVANCKHGFRSPWRHHSFWRPIDSQPVAAVRLNRFEIDLDLPEFRVAEFSRDRLPRLQHLGPIQEGSERVL